MVLKETESQKKSRVKLFKTLQEIQKKAYGSILDQVESVVVALAGNPEAFKPLRSKILRASNDAIRNQEKALETCYTVEYITTSEDVIEIKSK
jgi:hypothetical protein